MSIIWTIIIGFFAGLVARFLKPGNDKLGFIMTTVLGVTGALLATYIGRSLGWYKEAEPAGFIAAVIGAIVLLIIYAIVRRKR